jgi:dTDP-4-dehydrorhamnose 3,5-epimerase-like enzyme
MSNAGWNEPFDVRELVYHEDPRGFLFEILRFKDNAIPGQGQLYTFSIEPGHRRGDHYHHKKREWFTCVCGEVIVLLSHKDGQKRAVPLTSKCPQIIYAGRGAAHALLNETQQTAVIVSYGSEQHNSQEDDTIPQKAYEAYPQP